MTTVRLVAGTDGQSHFEDLDVPLLSPGGLVDVSAPIAANAVFVIEALTPDTLDFHTPPNRRMLCVMCGSVEFEVGDQTTRTFTSGDVIFAEDTAGQGHRFRVIEPTRMLGVLLDDHVDTTPWRV